LPPAPGLFLFRNYPTSLFPPYFIQYLLLFAPFL
jgi:hypothetical protein